MVILWLRRLYNITRWKMSGEKVFLTDDELNDFRDIAALNEHLKENPDVIISQEQFYSMIERTILPVNGLVLGCKSRGDYIDKDVPLLGVLAGTPAGEKPDLSKLTDGEVNTLYTLLLNIQDISSIVEEKVGENSIHSSLSIHDRAESEQTLSRFEAEDGIILGSSVTADDSFSGYNGVGRKLKPHEFPEIVIKAFIGQKIEANKKAGGAKDALEGDFNAIKSIQQRFGLNGMSQEQEKILTDAISSLRELKKTEEEYTFENIFQKSEDLLVEINKREVNPGHIKAKEERAEIAKNFLNEMIAENLRKSEQQVQKAAERQNGSAKRKGSALERVKSIPNLFSPMSSRKRVADAAIRENESDQADLQKALGQNKKHKRIEKTFETAEILEGMMVFSPKTPEDVEAMRNFLSEHGVELKTTTVKSGNKFKRFIIAAPQGVELKADLNLDSLLKGKESAKEEGAGSSVRKGKGRLSESDYALQNSLEGMEVAFESDARRDARKSCIVSPSQAQGFIKFLDDYEPSGSSYKHEAFNRFEPVPTPTKEPNRIITKAVRMFLYEDGYSRADKEILKKKYPNAFKVMENNSEQHRKQALGNNKSASTNDYPQEFYLHRNAKQENGQPRKLMVYFHANADSAASLYIREYKAAIENGYDILCVEYDSYAKEGTEPSEAGLYEDARKAINLANDLGYKNSEMTIVGESLGAAVATNLVYEYRDAKGDNQFNKLVSYGGFSSLQKESGVFIGEAGASAIPADMFNSAEKARDISIPVVVVSNFNDKLVPREQQKEIYNNLGSVHKKYKVVKGGHLNKKELGEKGLFGLSDEIDLVVSNKVNISSKGLSGSSESPERKEDKVSPSLSDSNAQAETPKSVRRNDSLKEGADGGSSGSRSRIKRMASQFNRADLQNLLENEEKREQLEQEGSGSSSRRERSSSDDDSLDSVRIPRRRNTQGRSSSSDDEKGDKKSGKGSSIGGHRGNSPDGGMSR